MCFKNLILFIGSNLKSDELLGVSQMNSMPHTPLPTPGIVVGGVDSLFNSPSPPSVHHHHHHSHGHVHHHSHSHSKSRQRKKSLPPSHPPSSSRASIVFPILAHTTGNPFTPTTGGQRKYDTEQTVGMKQFYYQFFYILLSNITVMMQFFKTICYLLLY